MVDSDDATSQRQTHYDQQRSSVRSSRSARTTSRPRSSQLLRQDESTLDTTDDRSPEPIPSPSPSPSPPPVIPIRSHSSAEHGKRRGSKSSTASPRAARTRDGRSGSSGSRYDAPENYGNLNEILAPSPVENPDEQALYRHNTLEEATRIHSHGSTRTRSRRLSSHGPKADEYDVPQDYGNLTEVSAPGPVENPDQQGLYRRNSLEDATRAQSRGSRGLPWARRPSTQPRLASKTGTPGTDLSVTALPPIRLRSFKQLTSSDRYAISKPTPGAQRASRLVTQVYTISYLVMFSILGTLARLGLQWLTFYPGAPVIFSELWANVGGTVFIGFLAEDRRLFRDEWGDSEESLEDVDAQQQFSDEENAQPLSEAKASHGKVKKTIPLYIGLATGFCGSFTSFSSFMRDTFFALSNHMPSPVNHPHAPETPISTGSTVRRNGGYSFMAVLAVPIVTLALCYSALLVGAHAAIYLERSRLVPTLPFRFTRRVVDPLFVLLAWSAWLGAIFMAIWPPDPGRSSSGGRANETWRGQAIFACVFAPLGCLLRFYLSLALNPLLPSFPLGTFTVNVFGTAVLGMAFDLQRVHLGSLVGGGRVGCQVLQGVMDGFCGCLTTVSTWVAEVHGLRRGHSYVYGLMSVGTGLVVLVAVMGSVKWTVGWSEAACVT